MEQANQHNPELSPPSPPATAWSEPAPSRIPRPTYWPAVMALGITFFFWSAVTSVYFAGVGLLIFIVAAAGWVYELQREHEPEPS